jgi:2-polyprenyl-6-methoxyphenol hydroxylase-like FAD-dependent oxidoreductase
MSAVNKVLVVGGGISGLTLAIALSKQDIDVVVVEVSTDVRNQAGVGLSLQGNSIAALGEIGLAEACIKEGMAANYLNIRKADGELLMHQPIMQMGGTGYPGTVGISRSSLHGILLDAMDTKNVIFKQGVTFVHMDENPDGVLVRFSDGTEGNFDFVVGADGLYSKVRRLLFPDVKPQHCGQSVWRAGVPRPKGNFTTELHFGGPFGAVGICPISIDDGYVYIVDKSEKGERHEGAESSREMLDKLQSYGGHLIESCKSSLLESNNVSFRPLEWVLVEEPWYKGRIMIIGDAAHSGPPVLAQGAAMGIEDAIVLSQELSKSDCLDDALSKFMSRRFARAKMVVENSLQLCRWEVEHSASPNEVSQLMIESQTLLSQPF